MPNKPKVSVIIPVYNAATFIRTCLKTLFGQTLDQIEYIFIDDASPDDSVFIIRNELDNYPHRKNQVKIIEHKENLGVSQSRQDGMSVATGEYIIHCDPDDWLRLDAYESLYSKAKETVADLVICDFYQVRNNKQQYIEQKPDEMSSISLLESISGRKSNVIHGSTWNKLIKSSICSNAIFPSDICYCEDVFFWLQILKQNISIVYLPKALYYYRNNPNSIVNNISIKSTKLDLNLVGYIDNERLNNNDNLYIKSCESLIIAIINYRFMKNQNITDLEFKHRFSKYKAFLSSNIRLNRIEKLKIKYSILGYHKLILNLNRIFTKLRGIYSNILTTN